ncbi:putative DNA-directed DNA polymerase [Vibrio nigripulchritudo FTn2]|uniref:DNA-directed DNA polymerase n=1 Tax=Vibrio nigripulchritudo TaxID=28173 RepID=UPI0003B225BF|nr:DNA-directed DNA polymerase [Vibrio nigripulchritudo]CCN40069.1 putative DNA-directed DNA polymerase [Vibrio nigripulchritudo FTn2]
MKIIIKKVNLIAALATPTNCTGKSDKAFSECLKVEAQGNTIKVSAVHNGLEANLFCVAESIEDFQPFVVDAKRIFDLVKTYDAEKNINISLNEEQTKLIFKSGRSRHTIEVMPIEGFPVTQAFREGHSHIKVKLSILKDALTSVAWAATQNLNKLPSDRMFLGSTLMKIEKDFISIFSADGLKCCEAKFPCDIVTSDTPDLLMPKRVIDLLSNFSAYSDLEVELMFNSSQVRLIVPQVGILTSSVCSQMYPDLQTKTQSEQVIACEVNSTEFRSAIRRFAAGVKEQDKVGLVMEFKANELTLQDPKSGSKEVLDADLITGETSQFNLQLKMIRDVTTQLDGETLVVGVNKESWAFVAPKDSEYNTKSCFLQYKL